MVFLELSSFYNQIFSLDFLKKLSKQLHNVRCRLSRECKWKSFGASLGRSNPWDCSVFQISVPGPRRVIRWDHLLLLFLV